MERQAFIDAVSPGAVAGFRQYGILASLTLAQAIIESYKSDGANLTALASEPNFNCFGIKGTGPAGSVMMNTQEWDGAKYVTVKAAFRRYLSMEQSIEDHAQLLAGASRYANLIGLTDADRACYLIWKDGYATDPGYPDKLTSLIRQYDLTRYDKPDDCPAWAKGARDLLMGYGITDGERPNDPVTRAEVWTLLNRLWWAQEQKKGDEQA